MDEGDIKISVILKKKCHNVPERTYEKCGFTEHQTGEKIQIIKGEKENVNQTHCSKLLWHELC